MRTLLFALLVVAGTNAIRDGEDLTIAAPTDQPVTDQISCGPNTGSRFLRSYDIDVSYETLRHKIKMSSLLFRVHLGRRGVRIDRGGLDPQLGLAPQRIQPVEIWTRVEPRILDARDHQRGDGEIGIWAERRVCEAADKLIFHGESASE